MVPCSAMAARFAPVVEVPPVRSPSADARKSALSISMLWSRAPLPTSITSSWFPRNFFFSCFSPYLKPFSDAIGIGVGFAAFGTAQIAPREKVRTSALLRAQARLQRVRGDAEAVEPVSREARQ